MKIYVASRLANCDRVRKLMQRCIAHGMTIAYDWTTHGQLFDPQALREAGEGEKRGVLESDVFVAVAPIAVGSGIEFGLALGAGKPIFLLAEHEIEEKTFYHLPEVARYATEDDLIGDLISHMMLPPYKPQEHPCTTSSPKSN